MITVLSFRLAGQLFGIDITQVKEINRNVDYTSVPRAPSTIVGLFNMRGQVVTLFDLAVILGLRAAQRDRGDKVTCLILKSSANSPNQSGFIIDKPDDVLELDASIVEEPPSQLTAATSNHAIRLIARLERELLQIIDPHPILDAHRNQEEDLSL